MTTKTKLTKEDLDFYKEAETRYEALKSNIVDRIDEILKFSFKTFGSKLEYWYFDGAEEGEIGPLKIDTEWGDVHGMVMKPYFTMVILLEDGSEWGIEDGIPIKWLTEDYQDEIVKGKKLYEKKQEEKKAKEKARREKKKDIAAQAKTKLSKAELKALGVKS